MHILGPARDPPQEGLVQIGRKFRHPRLPFWNRPEDRRDGAVAVLTDERVGRATADCGRRQQDAAAVVDGQKTSEVFAHCLK